MTQIPQTQISPTNAVVTDVTANSHGGCPPATQTREATDAGRQAAGAWRGIAPPSVAPGPKPQRDTNRVIRVICG
jgi:hypothetical protein